MKESEGFGQPVTSFVLHYPAAPATEPMGQILFTERRQGRKGVVSHGRSPGSLNNAITEKITSSYEHSSVVRPGGDLSAMVCKENLPKYPSQLTMPKSLNPSSNRW